MSKTDIAKLAQALASAQVTTLAALRVAADPNARRVVAMQRERGIPDMIFFETKHGSRGFSADAWLANAPNEPEVLEEIARSWAAGALLTLGDALETEGYLDHGPPLELIYHLRNGVAHGNKFRFTRGGLRRLSQFPADIGGGLYVIEPSLEGEAVLDGFVNAGDVHTILLTVVSHIAFMDGPPPLPDPRTPNT